MTTDKAHIAALAEVCRLRGIRSVVFSPGSRSAPLVLAFSALTDMKCYVIPDERSAGFFALGIAQQTRQTIAVVCTSGTAVLNLAPAICEAFYQQIPLLILTADRPTELVGRGENQTIVQTEIFANYIKASFTLPASVAESIATTVTAIDNIYCNGVGPVHINIPLSEPLYGQTAPSSGSLSLPPVVSTLTTKVPTVTLSNRNVIIVGMEYPDELLSAALQRLARRSDTIILTEPLSNLHHADFIANADALISVLSTEDSQKIKPTTLITIGRQTVSKRLRQWIRSTKVATHYHLSTDSGEWNGWGAMDYVHLPCEPVAVLSAIPLHASVSTDYARDWRQVGKHAIAQTCSFASRAPYCDWTVFKRLIATYPTEANIHYGNSSPIRYAGLFPHHPSNVIYSNRGTSGIDGCISTAAGAAMATTPMTICVTGDVGFIYDSHALWHIHRSPNLRIIVINNGGGNIFRLIDGPQEIADFEQFFETPTPVAIEDIAQAYRVSYYFCDCMEDMEMVMGEFYKPATKPAILEIRTDGTRDAIVYKEYFEFLKQKQTANTI